MDIKSIVIAVAVVCAISLVVGIVLGIAEKVFRVDVNEKEEKGNACEGLQGIIDDAIHEEKKKAVKEKERQIKKGNEPKRRGNVQTWQRSG